MSDNVQLLDAEPEFLNGPDGELLIKKHQVITDGLLDFTKDMRFDRTPESNFMHVAAIPTVVVEQWMREGFNIFDKNVSAREIVRRLKVADLDAFLTTSKRV